MSKRKAPFANTEDSADVRKKFKSDKKPSSEAEIVNQPRIRGKRACVKCFQVGNLKQASFSDKSGQCNRLCTAHAKSEGTFVIISPCVDCPPNNKKRGKFPDKKGKKLQLCTPHAKKRGTFQSACTQLSTAGWQKSIKSGKVKIQIDRKTKTEIRLFRCAGVSRVRQQHYVQFEAMVKAAVGKHGVANTCKKCESKVSNREQCHTKPKRTLSLMHAQMFHTTRKRQKRFPDMKNVAGPTTAVSSILSKKG